jgi:hypothetical protein
MCIWLLCILQYKENSRSRNKEVATTLETQTAEHRAKEAEIAVKLDHVNKIKKCI